MAIPFLNPLARIFREPPPTLACEFTAGSLAVARWQPGNPRPERFVVRTLKADALRAQPVLQNLNDHDTVAAAVTSALDEAQAVNPGKKRREIALLLPDSSVRINVLSFDQVPTSREEVESLIKFRLRKAVPFDVDDAAIAWQFVRTAAVRERSEDRKNKTPRDMLVAVTPRAIIRQYEAIFEERGYLPGQVMVSTLAGLHLIVDSTDAAAGSMLLRKTGATLTIALTNRGELRMLRSTEGGNASELFHDIYSSAVFYQDTYDGKLDRIFHTGFDEDPDAEALWSQVEAELGIVPRPLAFSADPLHSQYLGIFGLLAEQARNA